MLGVPLGGSAGFRPVSDPHLRTIVNLESGKGWERNMKRERKSERTNQLFVGQGYLEGKQVNGRRRTSRMSGLKMFKHVQGVWCSVVVTGNLSHV